MNVIPPANRLRNALPKIGIRPTIDGRFGGVRESLEGPVMAMAQATAQFLSENLTHACGLPVECVIADTCIGGVSEAARCAEKFKREGVGVSLTVTNCWCYGSETMDMDPLLPRAVWGFNGTERPGAVYLAAVLAGHNQKGLPAFGIYGRDVQDIGDTSIPPDVQARLLSFARAGLAVATMRGTSYLAMGGVSMGIAGSIVDQDFFQRYLGMRTETVDMTEFVRRFEREIYDHEEYERAIAWVRTHCREGKDWNAPEKQRSRQQKDRDWELSVKMALIARDLMIGNPRLADRGFKEEAEGHNALAAGFQGQRQWTDHFPNGDFLEAILNTSFDWNGIRQPFIVATENDALNGVSMLFGHLLSGGTAQLFSDVRTYWSPEAVKRVTGYTLEGRAEGGVLHLINSGPSALDWTGEQTQDGKPVVKPFTRVTPEEVQRCLDATLWCPSIVEYFPGGGWSTDFTTRGDMPVTMCRVNLVAGLGPVLQIAEGYTVELPDPVHRALDERTNPSWPTTWFVPILTGQGAFTDVYTVMSHWGANHGAICYGHIGGDLIALAALLRIPVDMHNVPAERVFRPAAWARFGGLTSQEADYRACATYGPLYQ
ncbi:MAG: L-fucose isomerase [Chloroherpetonaceae bacterium]|nr:L-fucose isomerase [Chthonomonadaceae bacterium]MDW8206210.1 L-fucose isomerase [Chloroherpetonaceae bacterium]